MPKIRAVTLTDIETGEKFQFRRVVDADTFIGRYCGFIRKKNDAGINIIDGNNGKRYRCKLSAPKIVPVDRSNFQYKRQLCWDCKRACGGCSWSRNFTPIAGWDAEETTICVQNRSEGRISSFYIRDCPQFIREERCQ